MSHAGRSFVPAAGRDFLLPLYDPIQRILRAERLHCELLDQAQLADDLRVLDVGCGTGTLAVRARSRHPRIEIVGLDPDAKALAIARRKADRAGVAVRFEQGFGDALPFADACFDRVFSSLMLHHLDLDGKRGLLREAVRVLRPGGSLHLVDFGRSPGASEGLLARLLHRAGQMRDQDDERIAALLREAGFDAVERLGSRRTLFGRIAFHRALRPR